MRGVSLNQSKYLTTYTYIQTGVGHGQAFIYDFQTTITNKGVRRYYPKIQEDFTSVDLSSNKFKGNISEFIGNLKGLRSLNVSNNTLSGCIPSSLGNLTLLESLDLSQNKLSGEIPQQLTHLTFLATLNISHNNLTGPIPQGTQLTSFNITSYEGNPGLCGDPLPEKCGNPEAPQLPPYSVEEDDSTFGIEFEWKFVLAGFGSGLVIGVVLADLLITRRPEWFIKIVAMVKPMIRTM
ncbi:unnamed protein product [Prunus armeniaca]